MNLVFTNQNEKDSMYPLTIREITEIQEHDPDFKIQADNKGYSTQLVRNITVLCIGNNMIVPKSI